MLHSWNAPIFTAPPILECSTLDMLHSWKAPLLECSTLGMLPSLQPLPSWNAPKWYNQPNRILTSAGNWRPFQVCSEPVSPVEPQWRCAWTAWYLAGSPAPVIKYTSSSPGRTLICTENRTDESQFWAHFKWTCRRSYLSIWCQSCIRSPNRKPVSMSVKAVFWKID